MKLIDTHTHLIDKKYRDIDSIISNFSKDGIDSVISIGIDLESSKETIEIASRNKKVYYAMGFHPHNAKKYNHKEFKDFVYENLNDEKFVAIGEIGLDYHYNLSSPKIQKKVFKKQIKLAYKLDLPIIIHMRDSYEDTIKILKKYKTKIKKAVFHCFTGDKNQAKEIIEMGLYLSFGGIITFKNSDTIREVLKHVPLEKVLVETDSPYLSPEPYRGKINEPSRVRIIAKKMSEILDIDYEHIVKILNKNAKQLFEKIK